MIPEKKREHIVPILYQVLQYIGLSWQGNSTRIYARQRWGPWGAIFNGVIMDTLNIGGAAITTAGDLTQGDRKSVV